jgi:hypothetical protein
MTSKLVPSNPSKVMVIRDVTPNIVTLSLPFTRFGKFRVGGRGTIVRLTSGALAVFSPVALTPEVSAKLASMGNNVKYITAPDMEHHIFISQWHEAFPEAHVIGPEGLPEKRAKAAAEKESPSAGPQVPFSTIFAAKTKTSTKISDEFDADFDYEFVDAHPNKELVFFYKPDKVLIEADYMFNLPATEQYSKTGEPANKGLWSKFFISLQKTTGTAIWQKRLIWYAMSSADRPGFDTSAKRINSWDFNTIIPCHGDVIQGNGKDIFRKVFEWHLKGLKA